MSKITTFLTYNDQAEEAANFYVSIFENSRILDISHFDGNVVIVRFELDGAEFVALSGGPHFTFSEGISLSVSCETQDEIDYYWQRLTADGGEGGRCGWLTDKFGVSWQVTPRTIGQLLTDPDPEKAKNATEAMLKMDKIIIADIEAAKEQ